MRMETRIWLVDIILFINLVELKGRSAYDGKDQSMTDLESAIGHELFSVEANKRHEWERLRTRPEDQFHKLSKQQQNWFDSLSDLNRVNRRRRSSSDEDAISIRREYRTLSDAARERYHRAVVTLQTTMLGNDSLYGIFVRSHHPSQAPAAHWGAAFYGWHREFLTRYELALRQIDPVVSLPYWDSRLDRHLPDPADSIIWSENFLGNNDGVVTSGPFANWSTITECRNTSYLLNRMAGQKYNATFLFSDDDINNLLSKTTFADVIIPGVFEYKHGGPHDWINGHMGDIKCSPTDPIFFMHHAFIDSVWEIFRIKSQQSDPTTEYPAHENITLIGGQIHAADAPMKPFKVGDIFLENRNGLSDHYTRDIYRYEESPVYCSEDHDCGRYLFCNKGRCQSKVRRGGNCSGLPTGDSPCEAGTSCNGYKCETPNQENSIISPID